MLIYNKNLTTAYTVSKCSFVVKKVLHFRYKTMYKKLIFEFSKGKIKTIS